MRFFLIDTGKVIGIVAVACRLEVGFRVHNVHHSFSSGWIAVRTQRPFALAWIAVPAITHSQPVMKMPHRATQKAMIRKASMLISCFDSGSTLLPRRYENFSGLAYVAFAYSPAKEAVIYQPSDLDRISAMVGVKPIPVFGRLSCTDGIKFIGMKAKADLFCIYPDLRTPLLASLCPNNTRDTGCVVLEARAVA
jgi:hypothetical protein